MLLTIPKSTKVKIIKNIINNNFQHYSLAKTKGFINTERNSG